MLLGMGIFLFDKESQTRTCDIAFFARTYTVRPYLLNFNMSEKIIVRMPPSPTGHLHLGTARAALFNWLFAKKNNGSMIFRWEDTDIERSKAEFEREIFDGLAWLGMDFERSQRPCTDKLSLQTCMLNI